MSAINTRPIVEAAVQVESQWIELTPYITKFSHILSNIQPSSASITLNSEHMNYKLDDFDYLQNGQTIVFRYGYLNEQGMLEGGVSQAMSKRYLATIGDINYQYGSQGSKFILKLIAKGYSTRKVVANKIWKGVTASQIALEIAKIHDLKPFIDSSSFRYESLPQGNMSNYDLLKKLAQLEDGFIFYVQSNELHFKKVGTYQKPVYQLNIRDAIVTDFNLVWQEISESKKISSFFTDEDGGFSTEQTVETIKEVGESVLSLVVGGTKGEGVLGLREVTGTTTKNEDKSNKENTTQTNEGTQSTKEFIYNTTDNIVNGVLSVGNKFITQLENSAQKELSYLSKRLESKRKQLTGDVTLVGVPFLVNDKTIIINNIHSRFEGSYYIEEVTHRIEESYLTSIKLNKHGIKRLDDPDPFKPGDPVNPENPYDIDDISITNVSLVVDGTKGSGVLGTRENTVTDESSLPDNQK